MDHCWISVSGTTTSVEVERYIVSAGRVNSKRLARFGAGGFRR